MFRTQLRALLRASVHGKLRIMFPMVALLTEFRTAKGILEEEKAKLVAEGVAVADDIEVGIMIEIPAAAMLADQFAKEVDLLLRQLTLKVNGLVCVVKWPVIKLLFHSLSEWAWMSSQCQLHQYFVHVA